MRGREHHGHRAALQLSVEGGPVRTRRVHHGHHVVHLLLEGGRPQERVGYPGSAPVEQDQPGE
jgi:hypothetical protein